MKNGIVLMGLLGLFPWLSSSCFRAVEEAENVLDDDSPTQAKTTLRLTTRSSTGVIDYPVLVLAYDADGHKQEQQVLTSSADELKMKLPAGAYRVSAITGYQAYVEPDSYASADVALTMPAVGYAARPLFVGAADVELGNKSASVDVVMSIRTASLSVSLKDLPSSVESASVSVARQYASLDMAGKFSSLTIARAECEKSEDGVWTTGKIYVFPGAESQTVLTISFTDNAQQYSYGYTVNEPLEAGTPYALNGTYKAGGESNDKFDLSGSLTVESWKDPRAFDFEFGEGASTEESSNEEGSATTETVNTLPGALSIWNGHVVAMTLNVTDTEEDLLLISLHEHVNVYSANAFGHENDAKNLASAYDEDGLKDWRIPASYDMQQFKSVFKDENISPLNAVIVTAGGEEIRLKDDNGDNVRYLCEAGLRAIGFSSRSSLDDAGKEPKYALRLMKKVHVKVNN